MAKMPELVQLGEQHAEDGLVIVGVNFDRTQEKASEAIAARQLPWPNVYAPAAAMGDKTLWEEAADIRSLPRILLIDRQGVLRHDVGPSEVKAKVAELLQRLSRRP